MNLTDIPKALAPADFEEFLKLSKRARELKLNTIVDVPWLKVDLTDKPFRTLANEMSNYCGYFNITTGVVFKMEWYYDDVEIFLSAPGATVDIAICPDQHNFQILKTMVQEEEKKQAKAKSKEDKEFQEYLRLQEKFKGKV